MGSGSDGWREREREKLTTGFRVPTSCQRDCGQRFDDDGVLVASSNGGVVDEDQCNEGISRVWSTRLIASSHGRAAWLEVA
jgi:hypothetical protein